MVAFLPRLRGNYALRFEDETGLSNTRVFDLRLLVDPAPGVNLERPSRSHDSLEVLPGADIPVHVLAEDAAFAVRSAYLAVRCKNSAGDAEPEQQWPLYDHEAVASAVPPLLAAFAAAPVPAPQPPLRPRPQRLQVRQFLSLQQVRHADRRNPDLAVVIMTGYGAIETAVAAIKSGAEDYLTKPFDHQAVRKKLARLVEAFELRERLASWATQYPMRFYDFTEVSRFGGREEMFDDASHPTEDANRLMLDIMLADES